MFRIDRDSNRITRLTVERFTDLKFTERAHLQEWLANEPDALGEELLIIQKEFAGFDDTRERLDLLALDNKGNIVVIENKLDDSGRDVVWQALKYASYCSNLSKLDIVGIFQEYLGSDGDNASEVICEFLDEADLEEVALNSGNNQRVILVAASFRKEVTSTALWLLAQGVQIQCFEVTPYSTGDDLFLSVEQIIPTRKERELMIGRRKKEVEEKTQTQERQHRDQIRLAFWEMVLEKMRDEQCDLFNGNSPSKSTRLGASTGVRGCKYQLVLKPREAAVDLFISGSNKGVVKSFFDQLESRRNEIEEAFGEQIEWLRLDDRKRSRIRYAKEFDSFNEDSWPEITQWMIENISKLESATKGILMEIDQQLGRPAQGPEDPSDP